MKRYITISMIISVVFFITNCSGGENGNTTNEINMIKGEQYTISRGQTIVKNEDNSVVKLYSIKNGTTTATLVSGSASIK